MWLWKISGMQLGVVSIPYSTTCQRRDQTYSAIQNAFFPWIWRKMLLDFQKKGKSKMEQLSSE